MDSKQPMGYKLDWVDQWLKGDADLHEYGAILDICLSPQFAQSNMRRELHLYTKFRRR